MKPAPAILATALATALLVTGTTGAFVLDDDGRGHPLHWAAASVGYHLVRSNVPDGIGGEEAVHRAFRSWSDASSNVTFRFEGFVDEGTRGNDGRNVVYWIDGDWPYDPALVASTFRTFDTGNGALIDADIVVNGVRVEWSVGGLFSYDIENTLAHEVGHLSGLGHSNDSRATMFRGTTFGETKKRTLEDDDVAGLEALYDEGARAAPLAEGGGSSGCSVGESGETAMGNLWVPILLFGLAYRNCRRVADA